MEHQDDHRQLADTGLVRRARLSRTQWVLLAGVALLLVTLELLLVYTYLGIGRAGDRYEAKGASTTLMANVQRETLQLALQTSRHGDDRNAIRIQRAIIENQLQVAGAAATDDATRSALQRIRRLLARYDKALAGIDWNAADETVERQLAPLLDEVEREVKHTYDQAEFGFYEGISHTLGTQARSQVFLLGIGALLFVLAVPLAVSLHRVFDTQLRRLSAFPRLSPFPVVELGRGEIRFSNSAADVLAAQLAGGDVADLLPTDWPTLVDDHLRDLSPSTVSHEVDVRDRTISWSFFPVVSDGVVHAYGDDITNRKRAEEALKRQSALSSHQAQHDALTGLGNRRKLMDDGERRLPLTSLDAPLVLAIFDLDGFKGYNDTFGHPAGDALLKRLGKRLRDALPGEAAGYRMGGDEFCVMADVVSPDALVAAGIAALREEGESFVITASAGHALIPAEASTIVQALQLADQRLYANKRSSRGSAGAQTRDALLQVLIEQDPGLGSHVDTVAELAARTAMQLGLADEEVARIRLAAELHDVGKAAIPDTILEKPGPLDKLEWEFVRRHTIIGERILAAAPALAHVAEIVRSSHERFDGTGYPDGLAGEDIPLAARILAIADAYDAMVGSRPYRESLSAGEALAELRKCAGTQFDAAVVEAFLTVVPDRVLVAA